MDSGNAGEASAIEQPDVVDDPTLGRCVVVLDDRRRTLREGVVGLAFAGLGVLGTVMGIGDAQGGDPAGDLYAVVGLVLLAYGLNVVRTNLVRLRRPIRMLVGERGFDYPKAPGPLLWSEIDSVAVEMPARRGSRPRLKVRVGDAGGFARTHTLAPRATARLESSDGWLYPETGTALSDERLAELMRERLTDFRQKNPNAPRSTRPGERARTSRH